ncbi:UNVERIFIED_CONTAM: hypothetical protein Slati_0024100 [Sesamum latifolium]|uniref:Myb/SANT-like domain-containing protein n=1 Tax=Sesamum latifolium TaxID=2727402 RepID=A0AAW2Y6N4_9LAMI
MQLRIISTTSTHSARQQKLLYTPTWTAAHDQCFIDALADAAAEGKTHEDDGVNQEALAHATDVVNLILKETFTTDQNHARLEKLRERYETFKFLIARPKFFWDRWDNTVHAPSSFWEEIV